MPAHSRPPMPRYDHSAPPPSTDSSNHFAAAPLDPGQSLTGIMEAPNPTGTVEFFADIHHRHRPGPVPGDGDGVFQPATSGKYYRFSELPVPDSFSRYSISAPRHSSRHYRSGANDAWLYFQNVRGLRTKIDATFLATNDCMYDVIIFVETGLDDRINSPQLFGNSFNVFRCDRSPSNSEKRSFGGVLIAVAKHYPCALVEPVHGRCLEQVCVSTTIHGTKLLLCAVYIPPDKSSDVAIIDGHISSIRELCDNGSSDSTVVVCGDYNQPRIAWEICNGVMQHSDATLLSTANSALIDGMDYLNLCQFNSQRNQLGRVLDLVFCSADIHVSVNTCAVPLIQPDSHHPPLSISFPTAQHYEITQDSVNRPKRELNYRKIDFDTLSAYLSNTDWSGIFATSDVDTMAEIFCSTLRLWFTENLPFVRRPSQPAWGTSLLHRLKRIRNACQRKHRRWHTGQTKREFKRSSEEYRRMNACLYKSYVLGVQTELRRNPKKFWNFVNSKRKCCSIPSEVYLDETASPMDSDSCSLFASFFSSVFASDQTSIQTASLATQNVPADCVDLDIFEITADMIVTAAKKLKSSHSAGPDGIPAIVLCRCAEVLALPLCRIFNASFGRAKFPEIWKHSFMVPVFKKGDRRNVRNYRGVTSLSAASKLFEIIVSSAISRSTKHYISPDQHGFMAGRSVTTNLLDFTSSYITEIERKAQVDVIYTDLKAAFDRIDHRTLLEKISRLGASRRFVFWLHSYLCGRTMRVKLDSELSAPFTNKSGVPQGSNLGPLLFILYFNDAAATLGSECRLVYADDFKIFLTIRCIEDCRRLQSLLDTFVNWCGINCLTISITKCEIMTFNRTKSPILFDYNINGQILRRVDHVNDLGVILDSKLTFARHRSSIISKATRQLGFIAKIGRNFTDPHCLKALYCALVRPILENASLVWTPYQLSWSLRIERVQKRFLRLALRDLPWRDPTNLPPYPHRCRLLGLDTLERRRKIQQALFVVKLLNAEIDSPRLLSLLNIRATQRNLRPSSLLVNNFHRTEFGRNEPLASCIRTFTSVEQYFDFDVSSHKFKQILESLNVV